MIDVWKGAGWAVTKVSKYSSGQPHLFLVIIFHPHNLDNDLDNDLNNLLYGGCIVWDQTSE